MKKKLQAITFAVFSLSLYGQVGIDTPNPNKKSALDVVSSGNNTGVLIPRLTTTQRGNITVGATENGLSIFNTTTGCYNVWVWNTTSATGEWSPICGEKQGIVEFTDCALISVSGKYSVDKPIASQSVYISVPVKVIQQGSYSYSVILNGVTFSATGTYINNGPQTVILYPTSGSSGSLGTYSGNLTIAPTTAGAAGVTCSVSVDFISRSTSTLKILDIGGTTSSYPTNLLGTTGCGSYSASSVAGVLGTWLNGGVHALGAAPAASYSGTAATTVKCVDPYAGGAIATLSEELQNTSIVWVGANEGSNALNSGIVDVLVSWVKSGKGYIVVQGDKLEGMAVAQGLGYLVEEGNDVDWNTKGQTNLPQVYSTPTGYTLPFVVADNTVLDAQGVTTGFITPTSSAAGSKITASSTGTPLRTTMVGDTSRGIFILGDKNTYHPSAANQNITRYHTNMLAWLLHNAPIN